ncbi:MAG: DUF4249 domain-containing protein [Chitinophagaceae bacterium]
MKIIKFVLGCILVVTHFGCRDMYKPTIISSAESYLVVEGVLNAGSGPTSIKLSRTFKLDDTARLQNELNAQVVVEGKDNSTHQLTTNGDGIYTSPNLNLLVNTEYRLRITTVNGKEYQSDYVVAKKTPPIDSLEFRQNEKGVQIYVNTHDDSNNTRYYRWDYDDTWEIWSYYYAAYIYDNGWVRPRTSAEDVFTCWKYGKSNSIILGSSARLQSDNIYRAPVDFIANDNEKLAVRYSILLRQYALDKKGYEFYEMMKKNTEGLGSVFDPQPSEIRGNIHCTSDPRELVIGYISAVTIEEKRFFIAESQLQDWRFRQECSDLDIRNNRDSILLAHQQNLSFYNAVLVQTPGGIDTPYFKASRLGCVECPARGGSTIRPSYW